MNSHVKMNPFYESEVFLVLDAVVGIRTDTTQEQFADTPRSMSCSSPTSNPPSSFAYSQNHYVAAYHPDGRRMINSSDGDEEHDPGQTEREHEMYNRLDETKNFSVADGFVSFTRTFKYLGSLIS
jgi:hypothetical protein